MSIINLQAPRTVCLACKAGKDLRFTSPVDLGLTILWNFTELAAFGSTYFDWYLNVLRVFLTELQVSD